MMKAYNQVRVTEVFEQRKFTGSISLYIHRWSSRFWTIGNNWVSSYYSIVWSISWTSIGYYRSSKVLLADSNNHHQFFFHILGIDLFWQFRRYNNYAPDVVLFLGSKATSGSKYYWSTLAIIHRSLCQGWPTNESNTRSGYSFPRLVPLSLSFLSHGIVSNSNICSCSRRGIYAIKNHSDCLYNSMRPL